MGYRRPKFSPQPTTESLCGLDMSLSHPGLSELTQSVISCHALWAPETKEVTLQVSEMFYLKILYLKNIFSHDESVILKVR